MVQRYVTGATCTSKETEIWRGVMIVGRRVDDLQSVWQLDSSAIN